MNIDLHIHTTYSDGEKTPKQILDLCNKKGMEIISITDHDNISGAKEAIKINPYKNIKVIPGIELNAKYSGGQLHILGYNMSLDNKPLNDVCNLIMEDNLRRIKSLVSNLYTVYGISFKDKDLEYIYNMGGNIGRPEIAKLCVKYGYSCSVSEAFDKLFEPIKDMTIKKTIDLSAKECIEYIVNAGGIVSLAHAKTLRKDMDALKEYIKLLQSYGLSAIEVYHSRHSLEFSNKLLNIADDLHLLCSAGSDYHGPIVTPNFFIGEYSKKDLGKEDITVLSKIERV